MPYMYLNTPKRGENTKNDLVIRIEGTKWPAKIAFCSAAVFKQARMLVPIEFNT